MSHTTNLGDNAYVIHNGDWSGYAEIRYRSETGHDCAITIPGSVLLRLAKAVTQSEVSALIEEALDKWAYGS